MYYVKMIDKRDDSQISARNFKKNEEKAQKYFNLLKQDALMHKNDYYDIDEEIKYSDIMIIMILMKKLNIQILNMNY